MQTDEDRFRALFEAHYARVLSFAARRTDPEAARDVVSETFLVAWRRLSKVPDHSDEVLPWLYGVARNVMANDQRSQRRGIRLRLRIRSTEPPPVAPDHSGGVVESLHIRQAMSRLSARDQEILRLVAWEGLDVAGAAQVMGCTRRALSVRLHRARKRLEQALAQQAPPAQKGLQSFEDRAMATQGRQA